MASSLPKEKKGNAELRKLKALFFNYRAHKSLLSHPFSGVEGAKEQKEPGSVTQMKGNTRREGINFPPLQYYFHPSFHKQKYQLPNGNDRILVAEHTRKYFWP